MFQRTKRHQSSFTYLRDIPLRSAIWCPKQRSMEISMKMESQKKYGGVESEDTNAACHTMSVHWSVVRLILVKKKHVKGEKG